MGSRLSGSARLITALVAVWCFALSPAAWAQDDDEARRLFDTGLEAFKDKDYPAAIAALSRSYKLDPEPSTLFAWAQAERLNGNCEKAVPLYRKFLATNPKLDQSQLVRENLALCEQELAGDDAGEPAKKKKPGKRVKEPSPDLAAGGGSGARSDVVVRSGKTPVLPISLMVVGAAGLGTSTGLFIASRASRDGADAAERFEDFERLNDRADGQQVLGVVVGVTGLGLMVGGAVWALMDDGGERAPSVSVGPTDRGGFMVSVSAPFL